MQNSSPCNIMKAGIKTVVRFHLSYHPVQPVPHVRLNQHHAELLPLQHYEGRHFESWPFTGLFVTCWNLFELEFLQHSCFTFPFLRGLRLGIALLSSNPVCSFLTLLSETRHCTCKKMKLSERMMTKCRETIRKVGTRS